MCMCVHLCARLCLIGPYWSVKTLQPQSACVCSLLTNMLSCGFVFVSAGLIAASAVCITTCACSVCVNVCGCAQECGPYRDRDPSVVLVALFST